MLSTQQSTQGSEVGQTKLSCNQPLLNQSQDLLKRLITFACETWCYLPFEPPYSLVGETVFTGAALSNVPA